MKNKRMLIIGPGFGHNTERKLQSLLNNDIYDITFLAFKLNESFVEKYTYVHFVEITSKVNSKFAYFFELAKIIWYVRFSNFYDIVLVLGTNGYITAPVFKFARKQTIKVFELWSIHVLDNTIGPWLLRRANKSVIKHADYICQNWWGIKELFVSVYPEFADKFLMYQLFFDDIYFSDEKHLPESDFVKNFLMTIPSEQIVCFWPRSFISSNNHGMLLEALGKVKLNNPHLLEKFTLYLWGGNVENNVCRQIIEDTISNNHLENNVIIVDHPFVPQNDIFAIEERSDFFVQIANDDILSTYIMEMICSCKPFILSNLRTFQFLNEIYGLNVDLVENDVDLIANRIEDILLHRNIPPKEDYILRKEKCKNIFSRSKAVPWYVVLYNAIENKCDEIV